MEAGATLDIKRLVKNQSDFSTVLKRQVEAYDSSDFVREWSQQLDVWDF
jgi:hypothetical protein